VGRKSDKRCILAEDTGESNLKCTIKGETPETACTPRGIADCSNRPRAPFDVASTGLQVSCLVLVTTVLASGTHSGIMMR